jgi:cytosine/adenosine deaminase-related metal-dependent hydrolase
MIAAVASFARSKAMPIHAHACEQQREIDECRFEHGLAPLELLAQCHALGNTTTIVHATHIEPEDPERLRRAGAIVCLTPSTERNLGDGLCPIESLHKVGVRLCIGTDSHARIDAIDELRSVEDHERLRLEKRNVLTAPGARLSQALLPIGTSNGAAALRLDAKDRVLFQEPIEARGDPSTALDALFIGGSSRDVVDVVVGSRDVVKGGRLVSVDEAEIEASAVAVLKKLA